MASESTEEGPPLTVRLPADLDEWLEGQAADLGVDRDTLLVQMLASYRATAQLDGDVDAVVEFEEWPENDQLRAALDDHLEETLTDRVEDDLEELVETAVGSVLAEQLDDRVAERVDAAVEDAVEQAVAEAAADEVATAVNEATASLQEELAAARSEFQEKLEDVRERVIQVKQEVDAKAPADHDHEQFQRFAALEERTAEIEADVAAVEERLEAALPQQEAALEDLEDDLSTATERLQTVAWAVSDLRETVESQQGLEAVDRIKRAAAKADVGRARCENCDNGVEVGLLTEPNCPHCEATVTDVEPASGFFSKPRLLVASRLESGEEE